MNERHQREEQLFADALARPATERAAFLSAACAGDAELRGRVESLLREHDKPVNFLDAPPERRLASAARAQNETPRPTDALGATIGRYTLLEKLGEGGCGVVYRAGQIEPVRREVALKIIKLGMDTREVIARFEAERQALALMDHPHIARALDAGATDTGRPFFVMELVRGTKITDYCDHQRLRPDERLRLFALVCGAVQHAHQKGVIHRDLKPSNILVVAHDGVAIPKVIDFGIAKATQGRLTDRTLFTALDQFIGTPAYMSPEQAEPNAPDVDTRSDLYSLGVLLYELLTGRTPLEAAELRQAGVDEIRRRIREEEPPRPSARLRSLDYATLTQAAAYRQIEPPKLVHLVSGDLDWIVMRCLEKNRTRRYETANALTLEIERYLAHKPVSARPPSAAYTLGKLVRRHRFGFTAGGAIALALLAGIVVSTRLYLREKAALERAEANERRAQTEATRSAQVARFMQDMLNGVAPAVAQGRDTKLLREILAETGQRLDTQLRGQPEVEADLRTTLGGAYAALGDYRLAEEMQRRAFELRRQLHGPDDSRTMDAFEKVAHALYFRGERAESAKMFREALARRRRLAAEEDLSLSWIIYRVGLALNDEGRFAEAEAELRTALRIQQKLLPPEDPMPVNTLRQIAFVQTSARRLLEAEATYREALSLYRDESMGQSSVPKHALLQEFGRTLSMTSKFEEGAALLLEALELQRKEAARDEGHPRLRANIIKTLTYLGLPLTRQKRWAELEPIQLEILAYYRAMLSAEPANTAFKQECAKALNSMSDMFHQQRRYAEAEATAREAITFLTSLPPSNENRLPESLQRLGQALAAQHRWEEASACFQNAFGAELKSRPSARGYAIAHGWLEALEQQGKTPEEDTAVATLVEGLRLMQQAFGLEGSGLFSADVLQALVHHRRFAQTVALARELLVSWEKERPAAWQTCAFQSVLGAALMGEGNPAEAEPLLRSGFTGLQRLTDHVPRSSGDIIGFARRNLEQLLQKTGRALESSTIVNPTPR